MNFKTYYNHPQYKLYCDVDGVLADFDKAARAINPNYRAAKFPIPKGFFSSLDKMPDADILVEFLKEQFGSNLYILTAQPENHEDVTKEKQDWIEKHFQIPRDHVYVVTRKDKQIFAENNKNHILIDDRKTNIKE